MAESMLDVSDARPESRRPGTRLWAHVAGLVVLLAALFPFMHPMSSFTSDEGAYALQVEALASGSWAYEYRAAALDPKGDAFPVILSDVGPSGHFTYVKHPAVPLALSYGTKVLGRAVGLHLLSLLGVVGAAVAAWLLAGEIDQRLRRPAFWLTAGGPVLVNGFMIWAHAPSAALAGLAMVGAARLASGRITPLAAVGMTAALAAGVLVRSEGLLFAGAMGAVVAGIRLLRTRRPLPALAALALVVVPAALVALAERRWISSIVGGTYGGVAGGGGGGRTSFWEGRLDGAWHVLLNGSYLNPGAALPMLLSLALLIGLGLPALRRWGPASMSKLTVAVSLAVVLLVVRFAGFPHESVTGLLPVAPLVALGVLLFPGRRSGPVGWLLAGTVVLFTLAVLATQYPEGGGLEWGGRYLSPVLVPLAVLAVVGLAHALEAAPAAERGRAVALLVGLGVITAAFSLATTGVIRARTDEVVAAAARHPSPVSVTTRPALPRGSWRADGLSWMLTDEGGLPALLQSLHGQGVAQVTVVVGRDVPLSTMSAYPTLDERDEPALRRSGLRLVIARS